LASRRIRRIVLKVKAHAVTAQATVGIGSDVLGYRIEALAGQGGMGVVYRAHDVRLKRTVALKLIAPRFALDGRFRDRFERETELAMALEHPNVVPIHDAGEFDGQLYLVMRYVAGIDVRSLLRTEGALEPRRALGIVAQVAQALDAAHAKGLVHRDVKPSNVLLDAAEHVYLADFGLTRRFADDGAQFADARSLGTPAYLAPEQIEGGPVDGRADVYSLGCLLFECLTGEPPFVAPSRLAVAWAHLEEEPPRISARDRRLPDALDAVIRKAMAKRPEERYPTCAELVASAEAALGLGQSAVPRRRRLLLAAALAIAVSLAALPIAFLALDDGRAAGSSLTIGPDKLVRVDPATNAIAAVIEVGSGPNATAVAGERVWVYSFGDRSVSEIDAVTNDVRHTTALSTVPTAVGWGHGPLLAADGGGAWVIGYQRGRDRYLLTRIPTGGGETREHSFGLELGAVAVADGAVWVLGKRDRRGFLLRIDPRSGRVAARTRLPASLLGFAGQGLAVGGGFVWVTDAESATVYRLDTDTGEARSADFGDFVTRPAFGFGSVWVCSHSRLFRIDARTLTKDLARDALPAEDGQFAIGYGSVWRHDVPSGTLMRFRPSNGDPAGLIPLVPSATSEERRLAVTSIAAGAGGVWLNVAADP
jgi:hypothetical protein